MARRLALLASLMTVWLVGPLESFQRGPTGHLLVAAAASLSGVAPQIAETFRRDVGADVRFNFAGSNTLARQIVEGARADVFVSADQTQMDVVDRAGRVVYGTRVNVVGNRLVVIVPARGTAAVSGVRDLASPAVARIAMGDPAAVPAGVYARRWLESVRIWPAVHGKVIPLPSSPAALAAVREQRADAGVVFASDAHGRDDVRVALVVPVTDAPEILYAAAVITGPREALARRFVEFLRTAVAQRIFETGGFRPLVSDRR